MGQKGAFMDSLIEINRVALDAIDKKLSLRPAPLRHPLPARSARTLGLVTVDGKILESERYNRVIAIQTRFPFPVTSISIFIGLRNEYDFPVFSSEVVLLGRKKRFFMVETHTPGGDGRNNDRTLFDRLVQVKANYPALLEKQTKVRAETQNVLNETALAANLTNSLDGEAMKLFLDYLDVYLDTAEKAQPVTESAMEAARQGFERYMEDELAHGFGVKAYKMIFGKKGGEDRAKEHFFGR